MAVQTVPERLTSAAALINGRSCYAVHLQQVKRKYVASRRFYVICGRR